MTSFPFAAILALQAGGGSALTPFLIQVVAIFGIFYFLLIRPQQKQRKQHEERLRGLRKGDEVVTSGGIVGEVIYIPQATGENATASMDDRITIKSMESRIIVERRAITRVITEGTAPATTTPKA